MKITLSKLAVALCLTTASQLHGQGFVYDQQSATAPETANYDNFALYIQPLYESFVPTLSSIGIVQLELWDYLDANTSGARMCVDLYSGSPGHFTLLGATAVISFPPDFTNDGLAFSGVATFDFTTPIVLSQDQTYYIEPVLIAGDQDWSVAVMQHIYPYGQLYGQVGYGAYPFTPPVDLWFREGIVVPEPSDLALLAMGGLLMAGILGFKEKHTNRNRTSD